MTFEEAKNKVVEKLKQGWSRDKGVEIIDGKKHYCLMGAVTNSLPSEMEGPMLTAIYRKIHSRGPWIGIVGFNSNAKDVSEVIALVESL